MELKPTRHICQICGGEVVFKSGIWSCQHCKAEYAEQTVEAQAQTLRDLLDEQKEEQIANLRQNLYKAVNAEHVSSKEVRQICFEIKKLLPGDFLANFYDVANRPGMKGVGEFLRKIDVEAHRDLLAGPIEFLIKSMELCFLTDLNVLVERAYYKYDPKTYSSYATRISVAADDVSVGIYDTSLSRDAFIAYSSKDIGAVLDLVTVLEDQGLECFVAHRNLRHGSGSVENYNEALKEAMVNCHSFVFVSSANSRDRSCDALRVEMNFIKELDKSNFPPEQRNVRYDMVDTQFKKPRVEYWIGDSDGIKNAAADRFTKEFFNHYERVYTPQDVADRVFAQQMESPASTATTATAPVAVEKKYKYCEDCGTENEIDTSFCKKCGKQVFFDSFAEFVSAKEQRIKSQQEALELERIKAEEEKKRLEEETRRAEEKRRLAEEKRKKAEEDTRRAEAAKRRLEEEKKKVNSTPTYNQSSSSGGSGCFKIFFIVAAVIGSLVALAFLINYLANNGDEEDKVITEEDILAVELETEFSEALNQDVFHFDGHYYLLIQDPKSHADAEAYCRSIGGHLATISTVDENTYLKAIIYNAEISGSVYIGGYQEENEGAWKWVTDEPFDYTDWDPVQPDNSGDLLVYWADAAIPYNTWDDYYGGNLYFLCEWEEQAAVGDPSYYLPTISTADELLSLNNSADQVKLVADIDLGGADWKPIEGFTGALYGGGHTISNFNITAGGDNVGFFATITGTVDNLKLENANVTPSGRGENVGILCGKSEGTVTNVSVSGVVNAPQYNNVGGVAGTIAKLGSYDLKALVNNAAITGQENVGGIAGQITNLIKEYANYTVNLSTFQNKGSVTASGACAGGIFGKLDMNNERSETVTLSITDFSNSGEVTGKTHVGGIIGHGYTDGISKLTNSESNATIHAEAIAGCIAGKLEFIWLDNCKNTGSTLDVTKYVVEDSVNRSYAGGFVGYSNGSAYSNCSNAVSVSAPGNMVGGIAGYIKTYGSYDMTKLTNTAPISGNAYVGGIAGQIVNLVKEYANYDVNLSFFKNEGAITAKDSYTGGIFGSLEMNNERTEAINLNINEFSNKGSISGKTYVGGILGYGSTDSNSSVIMYSTNASGVTAEALAGCIAGKLVTLGLDNCNNAGSTLTVTKYVTEESVNNSYAGGYVGYSSGGVINNCINTVPVSATGNYVGGIAGYLRKEYSYTMSGLKNTAQISGKEYVGGIAGYMFNYFKNYENHTVNMSSFANEGKIVASGSYVGGIFGKMDMDNTNSVNHNVTANFSEFSNTGDVTGKTYVGGLFGHAYTDGKSLITNSSNASTVTAEAFVGCIAGKMEYIWIDNCSNEGSVLKVTKYVTENSVNNSYAGGFVGYGNLMAVNNCTNKVEVKAIGNYVGGIAGYLNTFGSFDISNLHNTAAVSGYAYVGGIFGYVVNTTSDYQNYTVNLSTFGNSGKITATSDYAGGIIGKIEMSNTRSNCYVTVNFNELTNTGNVGGKSYVGGLLGHGITDSTSSAIVNSSATGGVNGSSNYGVMNGKLESIAVK